MTFRTDWNGWIGAAVGAGTSSVVDTRVRPLTTKASNGELLKVLFIAAQVLGWAPKYSGYIDGAAEWAVGSLAGDFVARVTTGALSFLPGGSPAPTVVAPAAAAPATTGVAVPASSANASMDLPTPGY